MRIALFGGSFDPPHLGHLGLAEAASESFALDRILLAPTGRQPLKAAGAHAPWTDRLAMCSLLAEGQPFLEPSEIDAPQSSGQPNFTIDTLRRLRQREPHADLFVLIGADAFRNLHQWSEPEALLQAAEWIVVSRPGEPSPADLALGVPAHRVHLLSGVAIPFSATGIRSQLASGKAHPAGLTEPVAAYIRRHHLYPPQNLHPAP